MKIIHCADIHLGSKIDSRLPREKAIIRRTEVLSSFGRMVEFAKREGVRAILISGDLFDSDRPFKKDKEFFYGTVLDNPEIEFFYLRGNHDTKESYTVEGVENLRCFSEEWTSYELDGVVISGAEISEGNCESLYTTISIDESKKNIVMLHGALSDVFGRDLINLRALRSRGIDYLALGHIHKGGSGRIDDRGFFAYPGCLEGRGFDECGAKGFLLLDTDNLSCPSFIKGSLREICAEEIDISGTKNAYDAYSRVKSSLKLDKKNLLRLTLVGEVEFSDDRLAEVMEDYLSDSCFFVSVKDKTFAKEDLSAAADEISIKGEFLRLVLSSELDEEEKKEIISTGLSALLGREVEVRGEA